MRIHRDKNSVSDRSSTELVIKLILRFVAENLGWIGDKSAALALRDKKKGGGLWSIPEARIL
jgi:hypothetical protein